MHRASFDISVKGEIDAQYSGLFAPSAVVAEDGLTRIRAVDVDQAALHALLKRIADLGLALVEVVTVDDPAAAGSEPLDPG